MIAGGDYVPYAPVVSASTVSAGSRRRSAMMANQVNRAINALKRIPSACEVPRGHTLVVCDAAQEAWNAFVESEDQALRSTHMEWFDGKIVIVEFPSDEHSIVSRAFDHALIANPVVQQYLYSVGDSYNRDPGNRPRYEPDESYGPARNYLEPLGVPLPAGVTSWRDVKTLKVEVGVSRGWGDTPGFLDWKAIRAWCDVPGVAYVLCIAVDQDLQHAQYKNYEIPPPNQGRMNVLPAIDIVRQPTMVRFDARRLLGIPPGIALPPQFPDPLELDLFLILQTARMRLRL